jgi:ribosome-associated protein
MKEVKIKTEYITLGQLLKFANVIQNGGETKFFLENNKIYVNNEPENRRGKKLYPGDKVNITPKYALLIVQSVEN